MFKWVCFGILLVMFIQNRLLKREIAFLETQHSLHRESLWEQKAQEHLKLLDEIEEQFNGRPNRWPVLGNISSRFGVRLDPFTSVPTWHAGIDIVASHGTAIYAPAPARVIYVGDGGLLGNIVILEHPNRIITRYGHLSDYFVRSGEWVLRGEKIAAVGNTGRSTAAHLHYSVEKNGAYEDPEEYLE